MGISGKRVFITAASASTCAGDTLEKSFEAILNGCSGISSNRQYSESDVAIGVLDKTKLFDAHLVDTFNALGLNKDERKTFLVVGSSVGGMLNTEEVLINGGSPSDIHPNNHSISSVKDKIERLFNFDGSVSFSTACTSSANAIVFAAELIKIGAYDRVIVAGVDSISRTTVQGFNALGVLSSEPCRPFDTSRCGMNVAEGIVFLQIEGKKHGHSIEILGCGATSDAYNITHPHPDGEGAFMSMLQALKCCDVCSDEIDYINAHGTATMANDSTEAYAIEKLFKNTAFVSSTKSITGHTLGAAGALEAAIVYIAIRQSIIPANTGLNDAENKNINLPTKNVSKKIKYAISNSFAFGGNNVSILFGAVE